MRFLFLLFIIIPIIEITVLINVGDAIGVWSTVGLVLLSAFIGVNMLRYQSLSTLSRAQQRAAAGEMPGREMVEGIVLAVGGALLITPGFVTDVIGFSCLLPFTRQAFATRLMQRFTAVAAGPNMHFHTQGGGQNPFGAAGPHAEPQPDDSATQYENSPFKKPEPTRHGDVIDAEYQRKDEK